jgi:hypothetical protein
VGIIGAAAWDGTKAAVREAFSFGDTQKPPPTDAVKCQILGTSSINCSGVGKFSFDFTNPALAAAGTTPAQDCSIFSGALAKFGCESNKRLIPAVPNAPLVPKYLNIGIDPAKAPNPPPDFSKFLEDSRPPAALTKPPAFAPLQTQPPMVESVPVFEQPIFKAGDVSLDPYRFDGSPSPGR